MIEAIRGDGLETRMVEPSCIPYGTPVLPALHCTALRGAMRPVHRHPGSARHERERGDEGGHPAHGWGVWASAATGSAGLDIVPPRRVPLNARGRLDGSRHDGGTTVMVCRHADVRP